jgi:hypothetical protein
MHVDRGPAISRNPHSDTPALIGGSVRNIRIANGRMTTARTGDAVSDLSVERRASVSACRLAINSKYA